MCEATVRRIYRHGRLGQRHPTSDAIRKTYVHARTILHLDALLLAHRLCLDDSRALAEVAVGGVMRSGLVDFAYSIPEGQTQCARTHDGYTYTTWQHRGACRDQNQSRKKVQTW